MTEALQLVPHKTNFKEISNLVDQKYHNFTEDSKLDMKIGIIMDKTLNNIEQCKSDIKNDLEEIKNKLYQDSNPKNQNLLKINVEEEVNKQEFKNYVIERLNKDRKIDCLFQQKKKNEEIINTNKIKIKNEEAILQETFYCVMCHSKPRCILTDCNHLVVCEDCIEKTKICRKCGKNIINFLKIFRS